MRVLELYTRHVATTRRHEPLLTAIETMREEHVGALIVSRMTTRNGRSTTNVARSGALTRGQDDGRCGGGSPAWTGRGRFTNAA